MRRFAQSAAASGIIVSSISAASAATLYNTPPVAPAGEALRSTITPAADIVQPMWDGVYIGVNAGGAWDSANAANIAAVPTQFPADPSIVQVLTGSLSSNNGGFIGGGQIGFSHQWPSGLVLGVETDFQGVTDKSSGYQGLAVPDAFLPSVTEFGSLTASKQIDSLGTVRARIGYAPTGATLVYATGGLAYGHASFSTASLGVALTPIGAAGAASAASYSDVRVGWTAGAGVEFMTFPNVSAKIEYLYYDLGSITKTSPLYGNVPGLAVLPGVVQSSARYFGSIARFGVNYHFNAFPTVAPLVAKY